MIKNRKGDKATRICDKCGGEKHEVSYWNLVRKPTHLCRSCAYTGMNTGRPAHNKGKKQPPKNIGNVHFHSDGYPMVWVGKTNVANGYIPVHRLVVSDMLGRLVTPEEKVHHINNVRTDFRPKNLYVCQSMGHHRAVHSQLEDISMDLVRRGAIQFDHDQGQYQLSPLMEQFISEKQGELLGSPNAIGEGNQQPSSAELAEKVQRLFREEVRSSDRKRPAPPVEGEDIVSSAWKHAAVHQRTDKEVASLIED